MSWKNDANRKIQDPTGLAQKGEILQALPDWMVAMRQAVAGAIKPNDLEAIFKVQVELARNGDRKAAKFVLDQARAFSEIKGLTFIQNNYQDGPPPDRATEAIPGTSEKLRVMRRRVTSGRGVFNDEDGPNGDLD